MNSTGRANSTRRHSAAADRKERPPIKQILGPCKPTLPFPHQVLFTTSAGPVEKYNDFTEVVHTAGLWFPAWSVTPRDTE